MKYLCLLLTALAFTASHAQETSILHYCIHASDAGSKIEIGENATVDCSVHSAGKVAIKKNAELSGNVFADNELKLDEFVEVTGNIYSNDKVEINEEGTVTGSVVAQGDINLKKFVIVQGDVISGDIINTEQGVLVIGSAVENASVADIPTVTAVQISVQYGSNDIEVDENDSLRLTPGIYGKIKLKKNSELTLVSGSYRFEELVAEEDTLLSHQVANSSVLVDVKNKIELGEGAQVVVVGGTASSVLYTSEDGDIKFRKDSVVTGSFIAGDGKIEAEERVLVTGALYANEIILKSDVQLIGQIAFEAIDERFDGTIIPPNSPPVADAGADQVAVTGDYITLDGSDSSDMDGNPLSFRWEIGVVPESSEATLDDPTSIIPMFQVDAVGEYRIQLVVNDGTQDSESDEVIVTTENSRPVADAGPSQSVFVANLVSLDGSQSSDANGDSLTYAWSMSVLPDRSQAQLTNADTVNPNFTADDAGQYQVDLIVSDGRLDSELSTVLINAEFPNTPPVAQAGIDQTVDAGSKVNLDGSLSSDSDGDDFTYQWSLIVVPDKSTAILDDSASATPLFTADRIGQYVAQLITNDSVDDSEPSTALISAIDPLPDLAIAVLSPTDFSYTNAENLLVSGSVNRPASVTINGSNTTVTELLEFYATVMLQEGKNSVLIQASNADANQTDSVTLTVYLDTQIPDPPEGESISVTPTGGGFTISGEPDSVEAGAFVTMTNLSTGERVTVQAEETGSFNASVAGAVDDQFSVVVTDAAGNVSGPTVVSGGNAVLLPPEPETIAPSLDPVSPTPMHESVEFLFTGTDPIQTGVNPDAIEPAKVVVIKGALQDFDRNPISGVEIRVVGQAEMGKTLSRASGKFDLVLNGGGTSILEFRKSGYLTSQRKVHPRRRTFFALEPVVLVALDPEVTILSLGENTPAQFASGSSVTDQDGTRTATLVMPSGTSASMVLPDGKTQPLETLSFRATEFTVGTSGPNAMPGELPVESGYTYAVELTADEAISAGATRIDFDQPVYLLVDNFIGFPAGSIVPAGYYDRDKAAWIPSENGVVIEVLAIANGQAELDIDGTGQAASEAELMTMGFSNVELAEIASQYTVGATVWRVPITHFTPWDCNWPGGPPGDASNPPGSDNPGDEDSPNCAAGSVIECQNQTLRETLPLHGTPYRINYSSSRVPGGLSNRKLDISITEAAIPASLKRVEVEIQVAGVATTLTFPALPSQSHEYVWGGTDAYDRDVIGSVNAQVTISYIYDAVYYEPAELSASFGQFSASGVELTGGRSANEIGVTTEQNFILSKWPDSAYGIAGWAIDNQHRYDPTYQVLYKSDGTKFSAEDGFASVESYAGTGAVLGYSGDTDQASLANLRYPNGVEFDQQGRLIIADSANHVIRMVDDEGVITTIAGQGYCGFDGDGGAAINAEFCFPQSLAIGPDNAIYVSDYNNARVRKIDPAGIITTVAGNGEFHQGYSDAFQYDGMLATDVPLDLDKLAVSQNGDLYLTYWFNEFIGKVSADGIFTAVAGGGTIYGSAEGDGMPATAVALDAPHAIAIKPNGNLVIAEGYGSRIREIGQDGIIQTIAGTGEYGYSGDGGPATEAKIRDTLAIEISPEGEVYFLQYADGCLRKIDNNGIIRTVAGVCDFTQGFAGDGGPSRKAVFNYPQDFTISPEGQVYLADTSNHVVRRQTPPLPGFGIDDYTIADTSANEIYRFDAQGNHLTTFHSLTGSKLYEFSYDTEGYLLGMYDADLNYTSVERSASIVTGLVSTDGQRTAIEQDGSGYLSALTDPAGAATRLSYQVDGLLTSMTDPNGNTHAYLYDPNGRLINDAHPEGFAQLDRTSIIGGYEVSLTTAAGQASIYRVENTGDGNEISTKIDSDGNTVSTTRESSGRIIVDHSSGYQSITTLAGDPRFDMGAPYASEDVTSLDSGLTKIRTSTISTELEASDNPLSLISRTVINSVNGEQASLTYTEANRTTHLQTAEGRIFDETIDFAGRITRQHVAGLEPIDFNYDGRGRLTGGQVGTGANARTFVYGYDTNGFLAGFSNEAELTTTYSEHDANGRVLERIMPDGYSVKFEYDFNGNPRRIIPDGKPAHEFTYNANNQITSYIPPATQDVTNTATTFTYDADRRLSQVNRPDGLGFSVAYTSSGNRPESVTTPSGQYTFSYEAGEREPVLVTAPGNINLALEYDSSLPDRYEWSGDISGVVSQSYNSFFQISEHTVNTQDPIAYVFDADQLMVQAGELTLSRDGQSAGLVNVTNLGGIETQNSYNSFGELTSRIARFNGVSLYELSLERDPAGRVIEKAETADGVSIVEIYSYDSVGRISDVTRNGVSTSYTYDSVGNRQSIVTGANTILAFYDPQDRLVGYGNAAYSYTANGELFDTMNSPSIGSAVYDYDVFGNLLGVATTSGATIEYEIDGFNRRIGKRKDGQITQILLYKDDLNPIAQLDGAGGIVAEFVYSDTPYTPEYIRRDGANYKLISDNLGSPKMIVNANDGAVVQRMEFDSFGQVLLDTNPGFQPFGFAGGLYDPDTKLVRFGARDYDAETARWTTKDPVVFSDGLNLYTYSNNDPVNYVDPTGEVGVPMIVVTAGIGAVVGGIGGAISSFGDDCTSFIAGLSGGAAMGAVIGSFGALGSGGAFVTVGNLGTTAGSGIGAIGASLGGVAMSAATGLNTVAQGVGECGC